MHVLDSIPGLHNSFVIPEFDPKLLPMGAAAEEHEFTIGVVPGPLAQAGQPAGAAKKLSLVFQHVLKPKQAEAHDLFGTWYLFAINDPELQKK